MKHSLLCSAIALSLFGCGGSSSDSENTPSQPQNTAPSLSGVANNTVKALQSTTVTLEMSDNESDALTFTIEDKPQWVTVDLSENTAALTLAPGFFDIGSHELALNVSDGELSQAYSLTVEVDDNPEQWRDDISLSRAELRGAWSNSANDFNIVFNGYDAGALIIDDTMKQFDYELNNSATAVNLAIDPALCGPYCKREQQAATLRAVAESDSQLRIHVEGLEQNYTVNMAKRSAPTIEDAYFTTAIDPRLTFLGQFTANAETRLEAKVSLPDRSFYYASLVGKLDGEHFTVNETEISFSRDFENASAPRWEEVTIGRNIDYIEPLYVDDNFVVYDALHSGEVLSSLNGYEVDDFIGLAPLLADYASLSATYRLHKVAPPSLEFGQKYIGRLASIHDDLASETQFRGVVEVIFDSASELTFPLTVPHTEGSLELKFPYQIKTDHLLVGNPDSEYKVGFFQHKDDDIFVSPDTSYVYTTKRHMSLFMKAEEQPPLSVQSFAGLYEHLDWVNENDDIYYSVFHDNGTLGFNLRADGPLDEVELSEETTHFWGVYDNRVVFIKYDNCPQATDFTTCFGIVQNALNNNELTLIHSFAPLTTEGESIIFNYSSYYGGWANSEYDSVSNTAVTSLRQLKKH